MEVEAVVLRVEGQDAFVKVTEKAGGCGRCDEPGGCGGLVRDSGAACRTFRIRNSEGARPGERVKVCIADGASLRTALTAYMLPVALAIMGAGIGTAIAAPGDSTLTAVAGATAGLALAAGAMYARRRSFANDISMHPRLRRIDSAILSHLKEDS